MANPVTAEVVRIRLGAVAIEGDLHLPARAAGLVVFAHGSGSSRFSRRNRAVATTLEQAGLGTLLLIAAAARPAFVVIEMNREAMRRMHAPVKLAIVPQATHLFAEPGALEQVATLAAGFCRRHL